MIFEQLLVKPVFNLLVGIYALVPGHNFGVALILFTVLVRLLMWPMIKKQLHHAKAMRALQPELKKIKKANKGNKQAESVAVMALYKEREINPFASIGYLIIQLPVFIALYQGVRRIGDNQQAIIDNAYGFVADLPWMRELAQDISLFDPSVLGVGDLTRTPLGDGGIYAFGIAVALISAGMQYYSSKQLMVTQGEQKSLREVLKSQGEGKEVDQAEVSAAVGKTMIYFIPGMVFFISLGLVAALPFYWFINSLIGFLQQKKVLGQDLSELTAIVDEEPVEAEVLQPKKLNAKEKKAARSKRKTS